MNLANKLTLLRLFLVPVILTLMLISGPNVNSSLFEWGIEINKYYISYTWLVASILFIIASLTDYFDGYWARKHNQITTFGKFFDPIADKILVNGVFIVMTAANIIPVWITIIIILRDIIVDAIRMFLSSQNIILAANNYGKLKTITQMIGITILFFINYHWISDWQWYFWQSHMTLFFIYLATFFSILSGIIYIRNSWKYLLENK